MEHGDPLVTAGAARPVTVHEAFAAIFRRQGADRGVSPAGGAKTIAGMVIVMRGAQRARMQAVLPTVFDLAGSVDGAGLSHGDLLIRRREHDRLSAIGGRADTDGLRNMGSERSNCQLFHLLQPRSLVKVALMR